MPATKSMRASASGKLPPDKARPAMSMLQRRFVLHWGEMGSRWGLNRTVAEIHALLYLTGRPMHAEELAETLEVARSNVSNSLRDLQNWNLIHVVHQLGDRRDHFQTSLDVWEQFRVIVRERKVREFEPTIGVLSECVNDGDFTAEDAGTRRRIKDTLALMESLSAWGDEMLRLEPETLMKVMRLGARIQKLLRDAKPR